MGPWNDVELFGIGFLDVALLGIEFLVVKKSSIEWLGILLLCIWLLGIELNIGPLVVGVIPNICVVEEVQFMGGM